MVLSTEDLSAFTYRLQSFVGEITAQTMYLEEQLRVSSDSNHCNFVFVEVEDQSHVSDECVRSSVRSAEIEVAIARSLSNELATLGAALSDSSKMHYISFYKAQKRLFRQKLRKAPHLLKDILTVDGSQGLDTDLEVLSFGRRFGIGFLSDYRRTNVAFTRAKKLLVVVMHQEVVETWHPVWKVLRGLRDISKYCDGYVWASETTAPDSVAQQVLSRLRQPVTGTAKTMVSDALQQHCYSTTS